MAKATNKAKGAPPAPPKPDPGPVITAAPDPPREFVLKGPIALGNGTRAAGTVVFTAEKADDGIGFWNPETVKKAEGITDGELVTVLNNPRLLVLQ